MATTENQNERVQIAEQAILTVCLAGGTDYHLFEDRAEIATDLLANLMHWCDAHGLSYEDISASAAMHHHAEIEGA